MHKVFVYGTLKRGYHNHGYLKTSKFIKQAYVPGYLLINAREYPYAMPAEPQDFVIGEVYQIDDRTLDSLDYLEGYPTHYDRCQVNAYELDTMLMGGQKKPDEVWIYYIKEDKYGLVDTHGVTHEWGIKPQPYRYQYQEATDEEVESNHLTTKGE